MQHTFTLNLRDVLFMRDARPMEASDAGLGANWPRPDQLHAALHHAFLRTWPTHQPWEGGKHTFRVRSENKGHSKDINKNSTFRFGALKTVGPFPRKGENLYFPCPLDLGMELIPIPEGQTDLPKPLTHAFCMVHESKANFPDWISSKDYEAFFSKKPESYYSKNNKKIDFNPPEAGKVFEPDRNIGIAINPGTGTTEEGKLYQAEYLRLHPDTEMMFSAECNIVQRAGNGTTTDVLTDDKHPKTLIFGGQQGIAYIEKTNAKLKFPQQPAITTRYLRWTLLTPAVFNAGWRPGWVKTDSQVMLKTGTEKERREGESRLTWRERIQGLQAAEGKLIAARIGKPITFSGWNPRQGEPKATLLSVPAGSSYVFDCGTRDKAQTLATELSLRPLSDYLGEKGYGIGICSSTDVQVKNHTSI